MEKDEVLYDIDTVTGPGSPKVRKRADRRNRINIVNYVDSEITRRLAMIQGSMLNFIQGGVDVATTAPVTMTDIKTIDGQPGYDGMLVLNLHDAQEYNRRVWIMRPGTWEALPNVNYNQLTVFINKGSQRGSIFIQRTPPPFSNVTGFVWWKFGQMASTAGWSYYDMQKMTAIATTANGDFASNDTVTKPFSGKIRVSLVGSGDLSVWDGSQPIGNANCYFVEDISNTPVKNGEVKIGDSLRWNGGTYRELEVGDIIRLEGVISGTFDQQGTGDGKIITVTNQADFEEAQSSTSPVFIFYVGNGLFFQSPGVPYEAVFTY